MDTPILLQETVYGVSPGEEVHVMSEKVQSLASSIYQEFERMIAKYDEDVLKQLMPLIVSVLEHLDISSVENQEHEVELELLREDNEQLVTQFEREKQLRKTAEQRLLELEYSVDDDRHDLQSKVESLESIVRILEVKAKNSADCASRLEEKELDMKKEYAKLHERYTEIFKTHMDYMERTKILFGNEKGEMIASKLRLSQLQLKSGSLYSMSSEESSVKSLSSPQDFTGLTPPSQAVDTLRCLKNELQDAQSTKPLSHVLKSSQRSGWIDGFGSDLTDMSLPPMADGDDESLVVNSTPSVQSEKRRPNTLYEELSFQDQENGGSEMDDSADIAAPDSFYGMGKEVENLIMENNELLATKNALNIVKDDLIAKVDDLTSEMEILQGEIKSLHAVKERLKQRVYDLEDELKKTREEAERLKAKLEEELDIPMAQKKRFTRVEMARVLMERNQYKEKLMELQETLRYTEMLRATRSDIYSDQKKNQSPIRKFFSSLFSSSDRLQRKSPTSSSGILFGAPSVHVSPTLESLRKSRLGEKGRSVDYFDTDISCERIQQQKARERKEHYRHVRAHVKKDDERLQVYGWSLPVKNTTDELEKEKFSLPYDPSTPVPMPVYCRPLMDKDPSMKIWCAAGVNLNGGRTRDGGSIVGASVFYSSPPDESLNLQADHLSEVEKLNQELAEQDRVRKENEGMAHRLSSLVWIGTSSHSQSKVNVIDARNPGDVLNSFSVCSSHLLCIASVPGASEGDFPVDEEFLQLGTETNKEEEPIVEENGNEAVSNGIGDVKFVSCSTGTMSNVTSPTSETRNKIENNGSVDSSPSQPQQQWIVMKNPPELIRDGISELPRDNHLAYEHIEKMSSVLPTMWMGAQNGSIYVHSSVAQWWRCIHTVRLKDAVSSLVHFRGRVFASLANNTIAVFHRGEDNQWALDNYHILNLGRARLSVRCMITVHCKLWCGLCNSICVIDPKTLVIEKTFDAHPRKESQVRELSWVGDGVWVSIRLDSTLRLFHAHTYQHLQDVDIQPYISRILGTGKLGFSFVRIASLTISCNRLWIGTGNGIILSVPLHEPGASHSSQNGVPREGPIRVYSDYRDTITPGTFIPYCSMTEAQLSFHGHRDAVKFFVAVPVDDKENDDSEGTEKPVKPRYMYIMSGAEGYIDFRMGDDDDDSDVAEVCDRPPRRGPSKSEQSHLIVWQIPLPSLSNEDQKISC